MLDSADSSGWGSHAGTPNYQNSYDPDAAYGNSNFDTRNAFKGNAVYQLPFGKGKPFLSHGAVLNEVAGGWQLSGSLVLSTGNPFTVTDAQEHQTQANGGGAFPNIGTVSSKPATPETSQPGITLRHSFGRQTAPTAMRRETRWSDLESTL